MKKEMFRYLCSLIFCSHSIARFCTCRCIKQFDITITEPEVIKVKFKIWRKHSDRLAFRVKRSSSRSLFLYASSAHLSTKHIESMLTERIHDGYLRM